MDSVVTTSFLIQKMLLTQSADIAQKLNISQDRLFEIALENFIQEQQEQPALDIAPNNERSAIYQGDIFWVQLSNSSKIISDIPHPYVVIQNTILNQSRISTVVLCALTSNLQRASRPGNVLLENGEANLPKQSVVEVSKVSTVKKSELGDYIGAVSKNRIHQILAGMQFLQSSFYP